MLGHSLTQTSAGHRPVSPPEAQGSGEPGQWLWVPGWDETGCLLPGCHIHGWFSLFFPQVIYPQFPTAAPLIEQM